MLLKTIHDQNRQDKYDAFLGMAGWYRRFINNYIISAPLTDLLTKDGSFKWTSAADQAKFEKLNQALYTAPILSHSDFSKPFLIHCYASSIEIVSVLYQVGDDRSVSDRFYFCHKN